MMQDLQENETLYKCKWGLCQEVFSTTRQLWMHVETHVVDAQTRTVVIRQPEKEGSNEVVSLEIIQPKAQENITSNNINSELSSMTTTNNFNANPDNSTTSQPKCHSRKLKYITDSKLQKSSSQSQLPIPGVMPQVPVSLQSSTQSPEVARPQQSMLLQEPMQISQISQPQQSLQRIQTSEVSHPQQSILQSQMPEISSQQQSISPIQMSESMQLQSQMFGVLQPQTSGNPHFQQTVSQIQLARLLQLQSRKSVESQVFMSTQQIIPTQPPADHMQKLMEAQQSQAFALQNLMNNQSNSPSVIAPANIISSSIPNTSTVIGYQRVRVNNNSKILHDMNNVSSQVLHDVNNVSQVLLPILSNMNNGNQISLSTTSLQTAPSRVYTQRSRTYMSRSQLPYPSIRPFDPQHAMQNTQNIQMPIQHNNVTTPVMNNLNSSRPNLHHYVGPMAQNTNNVIHHTRSSS
ncbi:7088_t:CDS:2 [Ambispora gerdemannii]|uniref:7088_t:CDS:1 n=1 Tax=Ambispora gerdemannii TaxID=144530 RepID=A0A9N8VKI6_9GLOM|nr:7088_t:CDS:2 [Ambispora gerdemannii]